jgi:hypothetical protein
MVDHDTDARAVGDCPPQDAPLRHQGSVLHLLVRPDQDDAARVRLCEKYDSFAIVESADDLTPHERLAVGIARTHVDRCLTSATRAKSESQAVGRASPADEISRRRDAADDELCSSV